jgi:predicted RNase H-like nuclease
MPPYSGAWFGIDGCRGGWFAVVLEDAGGRAWHLYPTLAELLAAAGTFRLALIDIPIGLAGGARECDRLARCRLGARRSSVFSPPARATLAARDYREALRLNRRHAGVGLSKQAWNLVPKIREVDALLQSDHRWRRRLRESHPELAFAYFNGGVPMRHNKRTAEGRRERLRVLQGRLPEAGTMLEDVLNRTRRRDVQPDDILDAMVLAVLARAGKGDYLTLPVSPPVDETGLAMEIVTGC